MRAIGFRAEPTVVHFAIVEGTRDRPVVLTRNKFAAPKTYDDADQLVWYREKVRGIIQNHSADVAGVRFPEARSQSAGTSSAMRRLRIEGVVMEAARSLAIPIKAAGGLQHIRAKLGMSHSPKEYMAGDREVRGVQLSDHPKQMQEAILIATAALDGDSK